MVVLNLNLNAGRERIVSIVSILKKLKWPVLFLVVALSAAFLHYFLPSNDVVRIVGIDMKREDVIQKSKADQETSTRQAVSRDVRYINAVWPSRKPRVYRNEDTGWGFPWYFKFDSGNLQAEAQDAISTAEAPRWFVVKHYGWRIVIFSMYPNAISIREVPGPDYTPIPWFNIVFLSLLALLLIFIWRVAALFRRRHVDPALDEIQDNFDDVVSEASEATQDVSNKISIVIDRLTGRK